ncbi:kallikrein 15, partial [Mus musculus]
MSLRKLTFLSPDAGSSHDLMLLQLSEPADITEAVSVMSLPTEEPKLGSRCLASGWGSTRPAQDGDKVLEGEECVPHSQPWQVALFERGRFNCGAFLISPRWVLTAAHCQTRYKGREQLRSVSRIIPHPGYEARTHRHDIMLLRLFKPARLTAYVRPVALPRRCPLIGEDCVVSGWGLLSDNNPGATGSQKSHVRLPDTLHCANISIISEASCNKDYPGRVLPTMVCAGVEGGGTDSCEGDSGGPLVCGGALQGIVSWGDVPCDTTTKPGVYTKVCSYLEWIWENVR